MRIWEKMVQLNNIWKDHGIPIDLKLKLLKCLIWPVMLYGCEAWTQKKADDKRIEAAEMQLYRRLLRVSWTDRRTNESILNKLGTGRKLLSIIKKRKLNYIGHATRNEKTSLMTVAYQGKVEAKRNKGRPPTSLLGNITASSGLSIHEVASLSKDRVQWRRIVSSLDAAANIDPGDADR